MKHVDADRIHTAHARRISEPPLEPTSGGFIVRMLAISSPQYVWTFFTSPFQTATGTLLSDVQWTITILIVLQTWLATRPAS